MNLSEADIDVIKEMYESDCDYETIADVVGCTHRQIVEAVGLKPENEREEKIIKLFEEGLSAEDIAEQEDIQEAYLVEDVEDVLYLYGYIE